MTVVQYLDEFLTHASLVALATASVYAGALGSYIAPKAPKSRLTGGDEINYEEELLVGLLVETAGMICLQVETVFKYFGNPENWKNTLNCCFFVLGIGCAWLCLTSLTRTLLGPTRYKFIPRFLLEFTPNSKPVLKFRATTLLLFPLAANITTAFFFSESELVHVLTNDILLLSLAHVAMSSVKVRTAYNGFMVFVGMCFAFLYTSGTKAFETATPTIPVQLLWPRSILTALSILPPSQLDANSTMPLSLGDLIAPGVFVALAYRLDQHLRKTNKMRAGETSTYLRATLIGHAVGLSTAFSMMHVFKTPQPVLFYFGPACCMSFSWTAMRRREWEYVWVWEDHDESKNENEKLFDWMNQKLGNDSKPRY